MQVFVPREMTPGETRVAMVPDVVAKLVKLGAAVTVEKEIGTAVDLDDRAYLDAGANVAAGRAAGMEAADMVLRLRKPSVDDLEGLKPGAIHISYLDPFQSPEVLTALAERRITAVAMELIPRTTIAQKMDALSSQANLGGYAAVILAAERLNRIFPMMMTPAGTLAPAKVFVIGVGVAGLQAIATAKRLGARVEAFDTRPVVEEQVQSLGARFVKIDLGETGQTRDGYAKQLTQEQVQRQREAMAEHCARSDVVITAAQVFGRKAPVIVTRDMIAGMRGGSIVVDCAVETGGNVEGSQADREVLVDGIRILAPGNLPGLVPEHASQAYASNLGNLIEHFWDRESSAFTLKMDDEIMQSAVVTHDGRIVNERFRNAEKAE